MLRNLDGVVVVKEVPAHLFEVNGFQHSADDNIEQVDAVGVGEDVGEGDGKGDLHAV